MLLIDAYNVLWLGSASEPHGPDLTPSGLLRVVAHSRFRRRAIRLVCDGLPARGEGQPSPAFGDSAILVRVGPGEVVYSGRSGSADDVIERIIDEHASPRGLLVVSSDRRVKRAARRRGARTIASEVFLAQVLSDRTRTPLPALPAFIEEIPLGAHAIDLWRREFGLAPEIDREVVAGLSPAPIDTPERMRPAGDRQAEARTPPRNRSRSIDSRATPGKESSGQAPTQRRRDDPVLRDLMQEWGLTMDLDDLDTGRWLDRRMSSRDGPPTEDHAP